MSNLGKKSLQLHKKHKGKLRVISKTPLKNDLDLAVLYTPGVGTVSSVLANDPSLAREYTTKANTVAVISDGSAVLGLGNVGPEAAIPVMEGKALLFAELANINAWPIVLDTQNTAEIIETIIHIAPVFGGINLEDIAAPKCFEIEQTLSKKLNIPVVHDDQQATAIVILAGLINALKVVKKDKTARIVIIGAGAAGNGTAKLLAKDGFRNILVLDSKGILSKNRQDLDKDKKSLVAITNPKNINGDMEDALLGADVVIGLSQAGIVSQQHIRSMNAQSIVFAMANPVPEIMPDQARAAGAYIIATGRSDFPNQINNVLIFPGLFKGLLASGVRKITDEMKLTAAYNLAALVKKPTRTKIIPSVFDKRVVTTIAQAIISQHKL